MVQFSIGLVNHQFSQLSHPQAVINIVKSHLESVIQSMEPVKQSFFRHHTGSCHRAEILGSLGPPCVYKLIPGEIIEDMLVIAINDAMSKIDKETESVLGAYGSQLGGLF